MALTHEDLQAIAGLLETKLEEKLKPITFASCSSGK